MPKDTTARGHRYTRPNLDYPDQVQGVHRWDVAPDANPNLHDHTHWAELEGMRSAATSPATTALPAPRSATDVDDSDMDWASTTDVYTEYGRVSGCRSTNDWPENVDDAERYHEEFERRQREYEQPGMAAAYAYLPHLSTPPPRLRDHPPFRRLLEVAAREHAALGASGAIKGEGNAPEIPARRRSTRPRASPSRPYRLQLITMGLPTSPSSPDKRGSRTPEERISGFATDEWVGRFDAKRVICRGCGKTVKLDQRSEYYDGLWIKHRKRCRKIKAGVRLEDFQLVWSVSEDDSSEAGSSGSGSSRRWSPYGVS